MKRTLSSLPDGIDQTIPKVSSGRANARTFLLFPFVKGINSAPRMKTTAGGKSGVIIILLPHDDRPQHVLGDQHENHTGHEAKYRIKPRPIFPAEFGVFVEEVYPKEEIQQEKNNTAREEDL
jgi:hypothetical protein